MAKLADLFIKLGLKSDSFKTGINDAESRTKRFGNSIKKIGGLLAGAFAVRALFKFGKESLRLYDIQAKAEAQLLVALGNRKDAQQDLINQAQNLQKTTLFGDEETIKAQALIAAFVKEEEQIKRVIPLVQDLATAKKMNLAAAADLVSKTLGSSTNALSRYGIEVTGTVGSVERLESLTKNLNEAFGGQAVKAAKAGIGALTQLQNAYGDLREEIGKAIVQGDERGPTIFSSLINVTRQQIEAITWLVSKSNKKVLNEHEKFQQELRGQTDEQLAITLKQWRDHYTRVSDAAKESFRNQDKERGRFHSNRASEIDDFIRLIQREVDARKKAAKEEVSATETILEAIKRLTKEYDAAIKTAETTNDVETFQKAITQAQELGKELTSLKAQYESFNRQPAPRPIKPITDVSPFQTELDATTLGDTTPFTEANIKAAQELQEQYLADFNTFQESFRQLVEQGFVQSVELLGDAFGQLLATGKLPKDFGRNVLKIIGGFLSQLGKMLILYSKAIQAFFEAFAAGPAGAVKAFAIGVALVAIGSAISGFAGAGPGGGSGGGGGGFAVTTQAFSPTSGLQPSNRSGQQTINIQGKIEGDTIFLSNERNTIKRNQIG